MVTGHCEISWAVLMVAVATISHKTSVALPNWIIIVLFPYQFLCWQPDQTIFSRLRELIVN